MGRYKQIAIETVKLYERGEELYETWENGNRADCVDACLINPALAAVVCECMDSQDRHDFTSILVSRYAEDNADDADFEE